MNYYQPIVLNAVKPEVKTESVVFTDRKIDDYLPTARNLLVSAGNDPGKQTEAVVEIVNEMLTYNSAPKMWKYIDVLAREFKIKKGEFNLAAEDAKRLQIEKMREESGNEEMEAASSPLISRVEAYISKRYSIYFNIISNKFMYKETDDNEFSEMIIENLYRELQKVHLKYSLSDLKALMKSDFVMKRNVFTEYFENLERWDGVDHIQNLSKYLKVREISTKWSEQLRFEQQFKKMFVRMVACSLERGFNKQCFTLVHEKQNSGKSTFLRWIVPPALEDYYTESIGTGKDDLIALTENIIVNIDELSTLSKYDINALKSVMSKDRIKVRLPYGDRPEILKRRCNFVASTNRLEFLNDETGSVRWVCFLMESIDWNYIKEVDINKVWAQAYHLLNQAEFDYQLTAEEIKQNEEANKTFLIRSPEMELIHKYFAPSNKNEYNDGNNHKNILFMTASDIVTYLQNKIHGNIKLSIINVGKSMIMLGFQKDDKYMQDLQFNVKGYYVMENEPTWTNSQEGQTNDDRIGGYENNNGMKGNEVPF